MFTTFENTYNYKETCAKKYRKKRVTKDIEHIKMQQHIDRVNKEPKEGHQVSKKKMMRQIQAEMQIFDMFAQEKVTFQQTASKMDLTLEKANLMMETLLPQIEATMTGFRNTYAKTEALLFKGLNVLDLVTELVSALLQVSFAKPTMKIASLAVETFRMIKKYLGKVSCSLEQIKDLIFNIPKTIKDAYNTINVRMQGFADDLPNLDVILQPTYIVSAIFVLLSVVFTSVLPKKTDMEDMLKRLGDLGRNSKGIMDLNKSLNEGINSMLDYFGRNTLKLQKEDELKLAIEGYSKWMDDVQALVGHNVDDNGNLVNANSIVENIMRDPERIVHVEGLYKKGLQMARDIAEQRLPSKLTFSFNVYNRYLTEVFKTVDTSGAFGNKPRTQPVVIWLYGESGVGKSGMSWPLAIDLNNCLVDNKEEARNFSKNIYMRNVEQEFWDNYQGQNVVIYDDFGQMRDSSSNPNMEFMELIRTANIAPYPLHMAHLEDKRKAKFTSKAIIMTSNVFEQSVNSLTFPDAFRRRVDLCAEVRNKDEYTKEGFSKTTGSCVRRLDKDKVMKETGEIISTAPYVVDLVNPETGDKYAEDIEYEDFLDMCLDKMITCRDNSSKINSFLMDYAERRMNRHKQVKMQMNTPILPHNDINEMYHDAIEEINNEHCEVEPIAKWVGPKISERGYEFLHELAYEANERHHLSKYGLTPKDVIDAKMAPEPTKFEQWNYEVSKKIGQQVTKVLEYINYEKIEELACNAKDTVLVNAQGLKVKVEDLCTKLAMMTDEQITKYLGEERYQMYVDQSKQFFKNLKERSMNICNEFFTKSMEFAKNHPFATAAIVLSSIVGLLHVVGFWKWLCGGKPKRVYKKIHFLPLSHVIVVPDNDDNVWSQEETLNLSDMKNKNIIEEYLVQLLKPQHRVVRTRILTPNIINTINNHALLFDKMVIVYEGKYFSYKGVNYELIPSNMYHKKADVEAHSSADALTFKQSKPIVVEASTSSDAITLKQVKPKIVEATTSGDCVTRKPLTPKILEAFVSADAVTRAVQKPKIVEAFASSDAVTMRRPATKFVEGDSGDIVEASMQMWKDQVAQKLITNRVLTNLYKICLVHDDESLTPMLNGMFVRSNLMLVPGHLIGFLDKEDTIEIRNLFDVTFRMPWKDVQVIPITNAVGDCKEAAILSFPKFVCQHTDLVKHFQNAESMSKFKRCEVTLPVLRYSEKLKCLVSTLIQNDKVVAYDKPCILNDDEKGQYILREGLEYTMPTISGDCGSPLVINETQVLRKIAGIHVAGDATGKAYAESITQKDLERAFSKINVSMQIQIDLDGVVDFGKPEPEIPAGIEFGPEQLQYFCDVPSKKMIPVGRIAEPLFEPGKTDLRPSLVYGQISEIKTKPAFLKDMFINGEFVNMKHRNLKKCAMDTPYISKDLIEKAYALVKPVWLGGARDELKKVLTYEEAIIGSPVSEYISSINRSSSPGFPWIKDRTKGTKGKQGWFGSEGDFILNKEVENAVNLRIEAAKKGIRLPVMWVDTLKDERRPIEKVNQLKTRVFSNGPMDFSIAFRMYYLGFIAHLMENRITNEVSIGTNVYSQDWAKTVRKLQRFGKKIIAGDFSTFDGSLNVCIMEKFADLANEFYDDGPENALIRLVLLLDVFNSIHICKDSLYMWTHSQPSGNPATTPLNCFINSVGLRCVFELCEEANFVKQLATNSFLASSIKRYLMKDFDKHVSLVSYGDDNVINFSDEISDWFNMETITEAFAKLGFTYTDELKGASGEVPKWRTIYDVQYLKRKFRYDEQRKVWEAPLCMDTILEMPNWCRGGLDIQEGTKVNCENAIMELSMHDQQTFDQWSKVIEKAYYRATGDYLDVNTYRGYAQERYLEYYM
ncbi:nonstructural polyprotein [Solenopsis invicta virus 5]|nr:nonstructural polyprotein [Solenopsis invicta virus 5]